MVELWRDFWMRETGTDQKWPNSVTDIWWWWRRIKHTGHFSFREIIRCISKSRRHLAAKVGTSKGGGKKWKTTPNNLPRMQCARAIPGSGSCQARPLRLNTNEWISKCTVRVFFFKCSQMLTFFGSSDNSPNSNFVPVTLFKSFL